MSVLLLIFPYQILDVRNAVNLGSIARNRLFYHDVLVRGKQLTLNDEQGLCKSAG